MINTDTLDMHIYIYIEIRYGLIQKKQILQKRGD